MSWRILITAVCTLWLSLQSTIPTAVVSAPSGDASGEAGSSVEVASMASSVIQPAMLLARHGEPVSAFEIASGREGVAPPGFRARLLAEMKRYREADSLLALHTPIDSGRRLYLHQLRRAALNHLADRPERVLEALAATGSHGEADFDGYRDFLAMSAHLALGQSDAAARVGRAGHERWIPDALRDEYEETLVVACQESGSDPAFALELTRALQERARGWRNRARYLHAEYEFHARAQDLDAARRAARTLVARYPRYAETEVVAGEIRANVEPAAMSVSELTAYASFYTSRGQFDEALAMLRALDARELSSAKREHRRILWAEYFYRARNYDRAVALAKPAYSDPGFKRRSILVLARSYRRMDRDAKAARLYEYFTKTFPNDGKSAEALYVAASIYRRAGDDAGYRRVLDRLTRSYPSSYYGRSALLMSARRHGDRGDHDLAVRELSRLVKRSRGTDEAALYYLSRSYESAGDEESKHLILKQLDDVDPFSFYLRPSVPGPAYAPVTASSGAVAMGGERGLEAFLHRGDRERDAAYVRIRTELADDATESDSAFAGCVSRGEWMLAAGLREWGERELETARRECFGSPARMLELGRIYDEYAMPWQSVRMYERVRGRMPWSRRGEYAEDFRYLLYPTPYPQQVVENAARYDVPVHLAYAMIRQESLFDLEAVSRVGALGLMQIMPATGRAIARELELPGWVEDDLLNPEVNVTFGVWYASSLLEQSGGDPLWMLAAYNAGPGNARRWFRGHNGGNPIEAVDEIDYKETRLYVQRIVESSKVYHDLYFGAGAVGAEPPR